jgi:tetratricopeptide (TPR) repeat protein
LATRATATAGTAPNDWEKSFSPSGSAVLLLTDLARRFAEMGMTKERRAAVTLLKHLKPAEFDGDRAAKDVWASELLKLAEDYRKANDYLEAGRLYSLVGKEAENFEGRAEALYKGGLLLFRSGRREEALAAFRDAAADGNNLFYSNLAKERLSQLEP